MFKKLILLVLISFSLFGVVLGDTELEQIQKAIAEKGLHWTAGKTSVSDLSEKEQRKLCGVIIPPGVKERFDRLNRLPSPPLSEFGKQTRWDWREHNGVTPVKDQMDPKSCGSCWCFAACGALESMIKIYNVGTELDLSEQQMLSCNTHGGSCEGGWMEWVYELFRDYGAIERTCMPYQADDLVPCIQNSCQSIVCIQGWQDVQKQRLSHQNALVTGPIAVIMETYMDFSFYSGGCYEPAWWAWYKGLHAVLIIGWDDSMCDNHGAWIIKNSWGTDWGEDGFGYVKYGVCDIGNAAQLIDYQPFFSERRDYEVGSPFSVFCVDLDGDIDLDLAVANSVSDNVSILKNNGDGTFESAANYGAGYHPTSVFCADLDGDTDFDLAVANSGSDNVSILKNNGDGTFQTKVDYEAGGGPHSVFCADLDGDSDLDLTVANEWSGNVSILKNNGDGTFQPKVDYGAGDYPTSVFCADLDGNTDFDLAVTYVGWDPSSGGVSILKNNGDGTFQIAVNYAAGWSPNFVFCADLDGDLDLDLAVTNEFRDEHSHNVSILKNNGDGTFQAPVNYEAGSRPVSVFCADLDGDTDFDLAVANSVSDNVSILKNNGDGTFQTPVNYGTGRQPWSVFCTDLDGDSDLDLAVANIIACDVSILSNHGCPYSNPEPGVDLAVELWGSGRPRPGFDHEYKLRYYNLRTSSANEVSLSLRLPPEVDYISSDPPTSVFDDLVIWDLGTVAGGIKTVQATVNVPSSVPAGTILEAYAYIATTDPEENYDNNGDYEDEMVVTSWDPNDMEAQPFGFGEEKFVSVNEDLKYTIFFENVDTATAEAIFITIEDTLDQNLDWSTLRFGPMSHSDKCSYFFNSSDGVISWFCDSIMLPPNQNPPEGEGWVSFSINPDSGLVTGTEIKNRAYIKFDYNPWIAAPEESSVVRTIDAYPPTSGVYALPDTCDSCFVVYWSGMDDSLGSGIMDYTIYVSCDGGPDSVWLSNTIDTSDTFTASPGHQYCFYTIARDNVGHVQASPESVVCTQVTTDVEENPETQLPLTFFLAQNYPNPFNPQTTIEYTLPKDCRVKIAIYNILGQRVSILIEQYQTKGQKKVCWDGKDGQGNELTSGIYFYRLQAGDFSETKKMVLLR